MANSNPSQLFLLADHIKLSLLERQRAIALNLGPNSQDGQISRSLDSFHDGLERIEQRLGEAEDAALREQFSQLQSQYTDLYTQFHGAAPTPTAALTSPNDPSLAPDFAAAQSRRPSNPAHRASALRHSSHANKSERNRAALFPYRDDPAADDAAADQSHLDNQQIHAFHRNVLDEQDAQLETLGRSIGRQRELSLAIGDELDDQALMLDDVGEAVDRHQGQLGRAKGRLDRFARKARDNWSLTVIVILILILVILIVILK
ncbi:hypothetical protein BDY21DRAFT_279720 [Lineolata rhizophorae]|uniref:t-SNARE coiled-coil homology domain-containing protein n=1 Tax=Lineolata rhizophorae TaxID=578093 RepID=A0A6A6PAV3_9PEZI|nr:hypothetical protein BDY21DRAFT_279720 [Lineolata rhizophorae]